MKKIIGLLLLCLLIGIFSACNETVTEGDLEGETVTEYRDFGGQEFIHSTSGWVMFWPEEAISVNNDRIRAKTKAVQEALNCVLTDEIGGDEKSTYYQQLIAVGDYHINFATEMGTPNCIYSLYKAGMIEYLDDIEAIDLKNEKVWGTPAKRLPFTYEGKVWAYAGGGKEGGAYGRILYNNELIKEFGIDSPQVLLEQNKWTFDTFKELLPLVSDTSTERKIYGLSIYPDDQMLPLSAIFANGGNIVKTDSSGKSYFGLSDNEALTALEWVKSLEADKDSLKHDAWPPTIFGSKGSTFFLTRSWVGLGVSETDKIMYPQSHLDDFGWIPFPYGPNAEYGKSSGAYDSEAGGSVIMIGNDKQDSGYVLNAFLSFVMTDDEGNIIDEEALFKRNFFQTEESYNNYKDGCNNFSYDYFSQLENSYKDMVSALNKVTKGTATPNEAMESIKVAMQAQIDISINGAGE